jgi:hypothetical protein
VSASLGVISDHALEANDSRRARAVSHLAFRLAVVTLDEALKAYFDSSAGDWHHVTAPLVPGTHAHEALYVFKPDVSLVVADGFHEEERHVWEWVEIYADRSAHNFYIDLLYNGVPIYRELAVSVDGGRAQLPSPSGYVEMEKPESGWRIERDEYEFVRQFSVIRGKAADFDSYFERGERGAGFKIV